jgi:hypothetical protein
MRRAANQSRPIGFLEIRPFLRGLPVLKGITLLPFSRREKEFPSKKKEREEESRLSSGPHFGRGPKDRNLLHWLGAQTQESNRDKYFFKK